MFAHSLTACPVVLTSPMGICVCQRRKNGTHLHSRVLTCRAPTWLARVYWSVVSSAKRDLICCCPRGSAACRSVSLVCSCFVAPFWRKSFHQKIPRALVGTVLVVCIISRVLFISTALRYFMGTVVRGARTACAPKSSWLNRKRLWGGYFSLLVAFSSTKVSNVGRFFDFLVFFRRE